ncbi:WD40-repeat-containing domain protein [Gymnopilus junonius]|uniref:WD40-repeat-containing domain protein n=1 Tax=Gymnopilus junonius TaxID=109634 RepID=A0A9P5THN6_GYMJU|nr:WD40-repeat-containing domain protein [Gymnopilus junonius]
MAKPQQESTKDMMPCGHKIDGRNLVVSIDGTSNQFGEKNTNVIELYNLILKDEKDNQLTWYNSGIGTYARPSWKSISYYKQVIYHNVDLAIAWDFEKTVLGAYRWLSDNYREGDCIFLFGFSRGAFQVRVLSAMIHKARTVGLIYKGNELQIPFAYELYADPKSDIKSVTEVGDFGEVKTSTAERFKKAFSRKDVKVHFVGAWDTISSIGFARGQKLLPHTIDGMKHVCYFRHALALDERRVKFLPEYAYGGSNTAIDSNERMNAKSSGEVKFPATEDDGSAINPRKAGSTKDRPQVKEVWFAGTHSDIGGGNAAMNLSRPPLRWMASSGQARKIHRGQKIHASLVLADPGKKYTPKARPPKDAPTLWEKLDTFSNWLEFDIYDSIEAIVDKFIIDEENGAVLEPLKEMVASGSGRQALYIKLVTTLKDAKIKSDIKYRLLLVSLGIMRPSIPSSPSQLHLKLAKSWEIRSHLETLTHSDDNHAAEIREFMTGFTDHFLTLHGHEGGVTSVAFSPDGQYIVSGAWDNTVRLWDAKTGEAGQIFRGHTDMVFSVAFSPDGNWVVSGSDDAKVRIWDVKTGKADGKILKGHTNGVISVGVSPDSNWVVSSSSDETVRLWNLENGEAKKMTFEGHTGFVIPVAFSPDGEHIISGSINGIIRRWNVESWKAEGEPFKGHTNMILSVAFSPDGKYVASGSADRTVRLWDIETGKEKGQPFTGHTDEVNSVAFSPNGKRLVSGSGDGTVRLWIVDTGEADGPPLEGHTYVVRSVAFSPDGKRVVSGSGDQTIRIWDVED